MASGPKSRIPLLSPKNPEMLERRKMLNREKVKRLDREKLFEGANSPLAEVESYDPRKTTFRDIKRERELRQQYRSPPAGYPESVKERLSAADVSGISSDFPLPGAGPYARRESKVMVSVPTPVPRPKARPTDLVTRRANETVVTKTPRKGGETVIYKTPRGGGSSTVYKTEAAPKTPAKKTKPVTKSAPKRPAAKRQTFNEAFAAARRKGQKAFSYGGRQYSTKVAK